MPILGCRMKLTYTTSYTVYLFDNQKKKVSGVGCRKLRDIFLSKRKRFYIFSVYFIRLLLFHLFLKHFLQISDIRPIVLSHIMHIILIP